MEQIKNCDARGDVKTRQSDSTEEKDSCFREGNVGAMPDRDVDTENGRRTKERRRQETGYRIQNVAERIQH